MRVFLSHASEQHADADRLAIALRARGHVVFLDKDDLPPGGDYQSRIEAAIASCHLFCFLIAPASIAPKRFTLSELAIARRRWPNPAGRVLPVMVDAVPIDDVPAYLRAVSILRPEGDLVADVVGAIDTMRVRPPWLTPALIALVAAVVVAAGYAAVTMRRPATPASPPAAEAAPLPSGAEAPALNIPVLDRVRTTLGRFVTYLRDTGFPQAAPGVTVNLYSKETPLPGDLASQSDSVNAFYYDDAIYVHFSMAGDMTVFLREYTHHVLLQSARGQPLGASAVESALADYYPASFLGSPLIGEGLGRLFDLPTTYLRRLDNARSYADVPDEEHARGEVWAGALWSCRQELGQAAVDPVAARAWTLTAATPGGRDAAFGAALASAGGAAGRCLAQEIDRRHLPRATSR